MQWLPLYAKTGTEQESKSRNRRWEVSKKSKAAQRGNTFVIVGAMVKLRRYKLSFLISRLFFFSIVFLFVDFGYRFHTRAVTWKVMVKLNRQLFGRLYYLEGYSSSLQYRRCYGQIKQAVSWKVIVADPSQQPFSEGLETEISFANAPVSSSVYHIFQFSIQFILLAYFDFSNFATDTSFDTLSTSNFKLNHFSKQKRYRHRIGIVLYTLVLSFGTFGTSMTIWHAIMILRYDGSRHQQQPQ